MGAAERVWSLWTCLCVYQAGQARVSSSTGIPFEPRRACGVTLGHPLRHVVTVVYPRVVGCTHVSVSGPGLFGRCRWPVRRAGRLSSWWRADFGARAAQVLGSSVVGPRQRHAFLRVPRGYPVGCLGGLRDVAAGRAVIGLAFCGEVGGLPEGFVASGRRPQAYLNRLRPG